MKIKECCHTFARIKITPRINSLRNIAFPVALIALLMTIAHYSSKTSPVMAQSPVAETEPNNTWQSANPLPLNADMVANLSSSSDEDWFSLTLEDPGKLQVLFTFSSGSFMVSVSDVTESGALREIQSSSFTLPGAREADSMRVPAGTYFIKVIKHPNYAHSDSNYLIRASHSPEPGQGFEKEDNGTWQKANALSLNSDIIGNLSSPDDVDFYAITLDTPGTLFIQFTLSAGSYGVTFSESVAEGVFRDFHNSSFSNPGTGLSSTVRVPAGTYYIKVFHLQNMAYSNNDYMLRAIHGPEPGSGYEREFNDTAQNANALRLNTDVIGNLSSAEDVDYFAVTMPSTGMLQVQFSLIVGGFRVSVCESVAAGIVREIQNNSFASSGVNTAESLIVEAGTYYIIVSHLRYHPYADNDYSLRVISDLDPGNPVVIDAIASPAHGGTVSGGGTYQSGSAVHLTALPTSGWVFSGWFENGQIISANTTLSLTATSNKTLEAVFTQNHITIAAFASPTNGGIITGNGTFNRGATVTLTATPNPSWRFVRWEDDNGTVNDNATFSFVASSEWDSASRTIWAVFSHETQASISNPHSSWAREELINAFAEDLVPQSLRDPGADLRLPITRVEFAGIVVLTYENLAGTRLQPSPNNPFIDTDDFYARTAYGSGLMVGDSADTFNPNMILNRETAATALTRVYKKWHFPGWTFATDDAFNLIFEWPAPFSDDVYISQWARESVYFMAANSIILGMGDNRFAPYDIAGDPIGYANATREQALLIALRLVQKLR